MFYNPPRINNKPIYVPVVCKNRDFLIGFIRGRNIAKFITDCISAGINSPVSIDTRLLDSIIDSTRFNDILITDKRESECTDDEMHTLLLDKFTERIDRDLNAPMEDKNVFNDELLILECKCGLGYYSFKHEKDIPSESFCCNECGRTLIHYTNCDDDLFDFDDNKQGERHENRKTS